MKYEDSFRLHLEEHWLWRSASSAEELDLSLESEYFLISRKNWIFQDLTAVGIVWDAYSVLSSTYPPFRYQTFMNRFNLTKIRI